MIEITAATMGSPVKDSETLSPLSLSTTSWTTPTPSSPVQVTSPSFQDSPARQLPPTPTERTMKSYVSPLQHLVGAAKTGDTVQLPGHASALSARAIRLTEFAQSAADTVKDDAELVRWVSTTVICVGVKIMEWNGICIVIHTLEEIYLHV